MVFVFLLGAIILGRGWFGHDLLVGVSAQSAMEWKKAYNDFLEVGNEGERVGAEKI